MSGPVGKRLTMTVPRDPQLLRVLRLVASGMASLGEFGLAAVEETRVAVDELASTLIGAGSGDSIEFTFEVAESVLRVDASTTVAGELEVDPLTDRILAVVATNHEWTTSGGVARGRLEKASS